MTHGKHPHPLPLANSVASLGHTGEESVRVMCVLVEGRVGGLWENEKKEWWGGGLRSEKKKTPTTTTTQQLCKKQKPLGMNIYSHAAAERGRNWKWVTVSQDS